MEKEHEFVLKILHVSPECAPLAKKGGLGDVAGALPKALRKNDIDARVLMPAWPGVLDRARELSALPSRPLGTVSAALNWRSLTAKLWRASIDGLPIYILENDELFANENIYPEEITRYLDSVSWDAHLGESYFITITGDQTNGYTAALTQ